MAEESKRITRDGLIQEGISSKNFAITRYDDMIWKVRTGYVAILYGTFTLVVGLSDKPDWSPPIAVAAVVAIMLIISFTGCALILDNHLSESKMKVIQTKERLVDLAVEIAFSPEPAPPRIEEIKALLHNAGNSLAKVDWSERPSRWPIHTLYIGTAVVLCSASLVLAIWS